MDFNRLTIKSQEAVAGAQELARRRGNPEITPDHLLLALLEQELPRTLLGERTEEVRRQALERLERLPSISGATQQPAGARAVSPGLDRGEGGERELEGGVVSGGDLGAAV